MNLDQKVTLSIFITILDNLRNWKEVVNQNYIEKLLDNYLENYEDQLDNNLKSFQKRN